ncbi:hypothetical protein IFM89_004528 [Coptis chinensis]|uniref:Uncharacterized protein n=1 Tax=Coptis chinensis TaxID=261450 RepID=A0A835LHM8_9MAGN|nr:hypothetical protein IFM89_004528 [Coptis chinensis]
MLLRSISQLRTPLNSIPRALVTSLNRISIINQLPQLPGTHSFSSHSLKQKTDEISNPNFIYNKDPEKPPKLFVVQPRLRSDVALKAKLSEALNLANSLEEQRDGFFVGDISEKERPAHVVVQNPVARSINSGTYFGSGTVKTIKCHIDAEETKDEFDAVFINAILSGVQQRNLEASYLLFIREWGKPILDRVGLIIEIFHAHAQTREAKLQSELAALMYRRTRLIRLRSLEGKFTFGASGENEVVSARGRGSGGRGFISGAGETELQLQRRRILERRHYLLSQIEEVRFELGLCNVLPQGAWWLRRSRPIYCCHCWVYKCGKSTLVNDFQRVICTVMIDYLPQWILESEKCYASIWVIINENIEYFIYPTF